MGFTLLDANRTIHPIFFGRAAKDKEIEDLVGKFSELNETDRLLLFTALAFEASRQVRMLIERLDLLGIAKGKEKI